MRSGASNSRQVAATKPGIEFTVMLWPKSKEGPCLRCLATQEMAELMRDIEAMPNSDPNKVVLKRFSWQ